MAEDASIEEEVASFRASVAPDQYDAEAFLPLEALESALSLLKDPVAALQDWADGRRQDRDLAATLEREPRVLQVIRLLIVAPSGVGLQDGRELPAEGTARNPAEVSDVALALGLRQLIPKGSNVESLCRIAMVASDARRRGFRRRKSLSRRVDRVLAEAINFADKHMGVRLTELSPDDQPGVARGKGVVVLGVQDKPLIAVANVFQDSSGGRQQRDLSATYPRLQEDLDSIPMSLVVLADGKGVAEAPSRILTTLFESVAACMTMGQAEGGQLADALEAAIRNEGARATTRSSLNTLISRALESENSISAHELPVPIETGRLALASFVSSNPQLALDLAKDGSRLTWSNHSLVQKAQLLREAFSPQGAIELFASALDLDNVSHLPATDGLVTAHGRPGRDAVLPDTLVFAAASGDWGEADMKSLARITRETVPDSGLAVLLVSHPPDADSPVRTRSFQKHLVTTVVPVDGARLLAIAGAQSPRNALVDLVLREADLTKANPFTTRGVTPREMFYGRSSEEADLLATLANNSAALIGGRRIGKTSLLQHASDLLTGEGWSPFYADLQEAGDWRSFAAHVANKWSVALPNTFAPSEVEHLVAQLADRGGGPLVLLFDEVDYLLKWDQTHGTRFPPEAFFRACRALSQEQAAQFVFSGERTIAQRLWDPGSPHWNFCRPLLVKQLARADSDALLSRPLNSLGVTFSPFDEAMALQWRYTQGHPQIVQFLGDKLVGLLNERPSTDRVTLSPDTIQDVVDDDEFRAHYVTTYWGQSTALEKLLTALVSLGAHDISALQRGLEEHGVNTSGEVLAESIRMLDLYGVLNGLHDEIALRATFMPEALEVLGGAAKVAADQATTITE